MAVNEDIMSKMIQAKDLKYAMHIAGKVFGLEDVYIMKSKIPVRKPTTRGGVYFTDTTAYKVKATTGDMSILYLLPKIMLGPNTEFQPVEIKTSLPSEGQPQPVTLISHVANTVNTKNKVELNLIVDSTM